MVGLDTHGTTVVRTPYTERRYRRRGLRTFNSKMHRHTPSFEAEVGTGQGDVGSPLNWIAFFDILLCALDSDSTDRPMVRAKGKVHQTRDTGYADDLVSIMTTLFGLQRKADIVSAFAIIFGLDIAIAKLRACKVEWGQENPQPVTQDSLQVHTFGWLEEDVQLVPLATQATSNTAEALKYLGVLFDYANDDSSSHSHILTMLRQKLDILHSKGCGKELKLEAIIYSLYPKARYPAKMAGWRLQDYHIIDKLFSSAFQRILLLPYSFPHDLLYTSRNNGGIGLPLFSTQVHTDKIAMMHRGLLGDSSTNIAMEGLLERAIRARHENPSPYATTLLPPQKRQADSEFVKPQPLQFLWVNSLLDWLDMANLRLHKHGPNITGSPEEPVHSYFSRHIHTPFPLNGARHMAESGLHSISDLLRWNPLTHHN